MDTKKRTFVVSIESTDDARVQLDQMLAEELKGEYIKGYKILDLDEKIKEVEQEHREFIKMRLEENEYFADGLFDGDETIDEKIEILMELDFDGTPEENSVYEHSQRDTLRGLTY